MFLPPERNQRGIFFPSSILPFAKTFVPKPFQPSGYSVSTMLAPFPNSSERLEEGGEDDISLADSAYVDPSSDTEDNLSSAYSASKNTGSSSDITAFARTESRQIYWLRWFLLIMLLITAFVLSFAVYRITRQGENDQFRTRYKDNAMTVIDAFQANLEHTIGAMDNLGVSYSSHAQSTNSTWPFLTLPQFEIRGASSANLANSDFLAFAPLVTSETRSGWEKFVIENSGWMKEALAHEQAVLISHTHGRRRAAERDYVRSLQADGQTIVFQNHHGHQWVNFSQGFSDSIYCIAFVTDVNHHEYFKEDKNATGPFFPVWQTTPVHEDLVNYDVLTHDTFRKDLRAALKHEQIVFGRLADVSDIHDPFHFLYHLPNARGAHGQQGNQTAIADLAARTNHDDALQGQMEEVTLPFGDPLCMTFFPVFDNFIGAKVLVGFIAANMYWSDFLVNLLPPGTDSVIVVIDDNCGEAFTASVEGDVGFILGQGDLHDARFDYLEETFFFQDIVSGAGNGSLTYSGVGLDAEYCQYRLSVYPSAQMENQFQTNKPALYAALIVLTLFFTSGLFILYDCIVQRRQKKVADKARQTAAVVHSLFPEVVRDRLLQQNQEHSSIPPRGRFTGLAHEEAEKGTAPIADLFPHTTIMFSDISGFTAWSSVREPPQVFVLLETIYSAFDALAKRRKVFKIETIGDSYVAATGLPEPQKLHAVIMAKFAFECIDVMNQKTRELEVTLGPDTSLLKMRFGLHSGAVTAGVLRGDRARFQLFGDTVNTASRMERYVSIPSCTCLFYTLLFPQFKSTKLLSPST